MNIRDAYTLWSATYDTDRNRTRDLDYQVTREVLSTLQPRRILEIGCGTGKNTGLMAEIGQQVVALDFSEGMIAQAQAKTQQGHVLFALTDLTQSWPLADNTIDLITCNLVLEHIPELTPIFTEAYRVLDVGGQCFISELHPFWQYEGKQANFQHGEEKIVVQAFMHHLSAFVEGALFAGFTLHRLNEWWHDSDEARPPRLITFLFQKTAD